MPRIRSQLVAALHADAIGPFAGRDAQDSSTESLELSPSSWYLTGFLAPLGDRETQDATGEEDLSAGNDVDEEESTGAEPEPKQKKLFPASLGLSVLLPPTGPASVRVTLSFAEYYAHKPERGDGKRGRKQWKRRPHPPITFDVPLDRKMLADGIVVPDTDKIRIRGKLETVVGAEKQGLDKGTRALSLFVVNERGEGEKQKRDEEFLFQVDLELAYEAGIVARPNRRGENSRDWDERVADLQFRERREYGVGHNVAVEVPPGQDHIARVRTCWMPTAEVQPVKARKVRGVEVGMRALGALEDAGALVRALERLPEAYGEWIDKQRGVAMDSSRREQTRDGLMRNAATAQKRIADGITLLGQNAQARRAFRLMNQAMADSSEVRGRKTPEWRLFQLAFVLLNLRGMVEPEHREREKVELIFFPTGGGKTEAYLGLVAFTLLLRRLRGQERPDGGLGVAVLLRYTLRLLTLDQLGRAATLMCALELIRRKQPDELGDARFAIGLWVGRSATANTLSEVAHNVDTFKLGRGGSPFPLGACPWCGEDIGPDNLELLPNKSKPERIVVRCLNFRGCAMHGHEDGLPVLFVDEQIYRELPAFVVATVDKFAMMPWRGETGMLFGRASARQGPIFYGPASGRIPKSAAPLPDGLRPPELIVQDELHLISGPLGTMVGLYETAIDALCTDTSSGKPVRPKIVASTATARRASYQVEALFGRDLAVFPPPGIDENETFFSQVDGDAPGRLYVGFAAPGRPLKQILLRGYVSLLTAAQKAYLADAAAADGYMSLAGYFNSLRELGGMRRLVEDQVRAYAVQHVERVPADWIGDNPWFAPREIQEPVELTSRIKTDDIKASKLRLEKAFAEGRVDTLLASNMISVGVDIDRLGLMVVAGQPKTTSEYIQASSRVGRDQRWPGLVLTCFNVVKARDRSHYERFTAYHESFYRHIEAQSLTPFSEPALDRGLVGTLLAMARLENPVLTPPAGAMEIAEQRAAAEACIAELRRHAERGADDGASRAERVEKRAMNVLDAWESLARSAKNQALRVYSPYEPNPRGGKPILRTALDEDPDQGSDAEKFVAPTSMREVEPAAHLWFTTSLPPQWRKK